MNWNSFTPIQDRAIQTIINTNKDVILSSGTASGKTEAAFLPILSLVEKSADQKLKVLYVSPLKALINNQFERITQLCDELYIHVQKWHGDVSSSTKKKFLKNPQGILQITPESIESFFVNHSEKLTEIFNNIEFIVIDEIHSFINSDRGVHLRSLIARISDFIENPPRIVALSATIDNFELVKQWVNYQNPNNVEVISIKESDKALQYSLMHFNSSKDNNIPLELFEDIRELTKYQKALIFTNSRAQVEELTVILNRICVKEGDCEMYYPHHSSIDKAEREFVEKTVATSTIPKSIIATSSLELGIDIGSIDIVIQLDSTFTVSSLIQRLGRSGRNKGASQKLQLYSTNSESLLQSLAVMELVIERWVEPADGYKYPIDILFHQIISICKEKNGIHPDMLLEKIAMIPLLNSINIEDQIYLINYMLDTNILEEIKGSGEFIVGLEGERILRGKEFYAVFMTPEMYSVVNGVKPIGEISKTNLINEGDNIILAGRLWVIESIDERLNKIYVKRAFDGNPPKYLGDGVKIHKRIPEKMVEILCSNQSFGYLNEDAITILNDLRMPYRFNGMSNKQRVIWKMKDHQLFHMFTGTVIANTFNLILNYNLGENKESHPIRGAILPLDFDILAFLQKIVNTKWTKEMLLMMIDQENLIETKFTEYLPLKLRKEMQYAREYNIDELIDYINSYEFKVIDYN